MYIEKKYWDALDEANLVEGLCPGKNDYKTGGIFYGLILAPKREYVLSIDIYGIKQEHKTFKEFNDSKQFLNRSQCFKMMQGKKYHFCYQNCGKNRLIVELSHLRK